MIAGLLACLFVGDSAAQGAAQAFEPIGADRVRDRRASGRRIRRGGGLDDAGDPCPLRYRRYWHQRPG